MEINKPTRRYIQTFSIQVLYQEPNPGIVYRYVIPGNGVSPSSHIGHKTGIQLFL